MWDPNAEDYDCDMFVPLPNEISATTSTTISPKKNPTSSFSGFDAIGRGIPATTLVTESPGIRRPDSSVQVPTKSSNDDEIIAMMRNSGFDPVFDTNLSMKTTMKMPNTERVVPGKIPLFLDMDFKLKSNRPKLKQEAELSQTIESQDLNSSFSSEASTNSSVSYGVLESDSSTYSSGSTASTYCRYTSPVVGVSRHDRVLTPRELYMSRSSRR